ncbi:glycoside hydrolase family 78 protein [Chitinophagaceae bacterium LB-8]|uniref:alpha-L-rhamnosidase n=1 Tax=Paraflavisolibacter caeni TaxID=2982496 RepID=A0A9X3BJZ7_9BACT|nr:glycoside hydrolase family 78 protein [Paraflavisolibacter caeni]MCU7551903.1 glycoside hydrolase family 78 protein [Paraflavisolibacter caeni]
MRKFCLSIFAVVAIALLIAFQKKDAVQLVNLRCEMLLNPEGIETKSPRLSWELESKERNVEQTAYQVLVASSEAKLKAGEGDLWNSGKVASDRSIHIYYKGKPLASRTNCFWKVKVWTNKGECSWSEPAHWSVGLLKESDWSAKWIGMDSAFAWDSVSKFARLSARYFRKEFNAPAQIKKATLYIAGLGLYELYINGQRVGNHVLAPAPTEYSKTVKYNTFDVTALVKVGGNAFGTVLGNGRFFTMRQNYKPQKWHTFGFPKMLLQLEVEYADGRKMQIKSDESWKMTADGPIRTNNEYDGEEYDATKEWPGWNTAGFNDGKWLQSQLVKAPGGKLEAQMNEPMRVVENIQPASVKQLKPRTFIMDMGQNMAGWVKMKVRGKKGEQVTLRFAETLQNNGELYVANLRDAKVTDIYTLKGEGEEVWEPTFVYHGFRYVEITGYPGTPTTKDFEGRVVNDDLKTIGTFETSNSIINQIFKNSFWGIRSNYKGMPVDCPQRNERQPWLGDRSTGAYGESFIFDNVKLYAKWLDDIHQSQTEEGSIPDVAPNFWYYYKDNMTWPGTYLMIANTLYDQFGDKEPIVKHYNSMKKWLAYMRKKYMTADYIVTKDSYGDWCVPPESKELIHSQDPARKTDAQVIATAYYYYMLQLMQRFATMQNMSQDVKEYAALSIKIKDEFNKKFFNRSTFQYSNNTVTANLLPLSFGMVPENAKARVFQNVVDKILIENKGHISTGVIGTQWLMRGLTTMGRPDVAYGIAAAKDYPSWGYMAENGATTIWELWNGNTANPSMNSGNHVMLLGDLIVWYYENLAGIKSSKKFPGYKRIEMKPVTVDGLDYVKASYQSIHGVIRSEWKKEGGQFIWNITIPANTKAEVHIPANSKDDVREGGRKIAAGADIKFIRMEDGRAVFQVGSGSYAFVAPHPQSAKGGERVASRP